MAHCFYPTRLKLLWYGCLTMVTSVAAAQASEMTAEPSTAQKIIDARPGQAFITPNDLLSISGIGQRTLEKIQAYLIFEEANSE